MENLSTRLEGTRAKFRLESSARLYFHERWKINGAFSEDFPAATFTVLRTLEKIPSRGEHRRGECLRNESVKSNECNLINR